MSKISLVGEGFVSDRSLRQDIIDKLDYEPSIDAANPRRV